MSAFAMLMAPKPKVEPPPPKPKGRSKKEEKIAAPTIAPEAAEGESAGSAADVIDVEAIAEVEPAEVEEAEEFVVEAVLDSKCESRPVLCCERCVVPGPDSPLAATRRQQAQ